MEAEYHVLQVISSGLFNLARLDRVEPCVPPIRRRPTETTRQFIERAMRENHGYTVPERWLADLDAIPDGDTGEPQSGYLVGTDTPTTQEGALLRKLAEEFGDGPTTASPRKMRAEVLMPSTPSSGVTTRSTMSHLMEAPGSQAGAEKTRSLFLTPSRPENETAGNERD